MFTPEHLNHFQSGFTLIPMMWTIKNKFDADPFNLDQKAVMPGANESQKTRNKKQNALAHSQFIICVTPKQKKNIPSFENHVFSRKCAKQPINNLSPVTWLCTWLAK